MKNFVAMVIWFACYSCYSEELWVTQSGAGSADGSSLANAWSVTSFNTAGNWGAGIGKISAGDTLHLSGVITSQIICRGDGASGNPITIIFESGAKLSQAAGTLADCESHAFIIFDGGVNGTIENTDNGTGLGHQSAISGIYASGSHDVEVRNLTFQNLYIHTLVTDAANFSFDAQGALYMNGFGNNISVHNCAFSNICWCINLQAGSGTGVNVYSNSFIDYDHGVTGLGDAYSSVNIYNNHFGSTSNWDTAGDVWHHDGIHIFFGAGGRLSNVNIYNNVFDGDWGINNTAHIFCEGDFNHINRNAVSNLTCYNNVHLQSAANLLNNGFVTGSGTNCASYNCTYLGSGVDGSLGFSWIGLNFAFTNNIISGVNTFFNLMSTSSIRGINNNLYAAVSSGGNSPFALSGASYSTFSSWKSATSGESASAQVSIAGLGTAGNPQQGSAAIDAGATLSGFSTDKNGASRPQGAWDIGAYEYQPPAATLNSGAFGSWRTQ